MKQKNTIRADQDAAKVPVGTCAVALASITRDPELQPRTGTNDAAVTRYTNVMKSGVELPPVRIVRVKGDPLLVDGWHRIQACACAGNPTIMAEISEGTCEEAMQQAALANTKHGIPLKTKELRNVLNLFIKGGGHRKHNLKGKPSVMSYREIAEKLSGVVSHNTIRNWIQKDWPKLAARMAKADPEVEAEAERPATLEALSMAPFRAAKSEIDAAWNDAQKIERDCLEYRGDLYRRAQQFVHDLRYQHGRDLEADMLAAFRDEFDEDPEDATVASPAAPAGGLMGQWKARAGTRRGLAGTGEARKYPDF